LRGRGEEGERVRRGEWENGRKGEGENLKTKDKSKKRQDLTPHASRRKTGKTARPA